MPVKEGVGNGVGTG